MASNALIKEHCFTLLGKRIFCWRHVRRLLIGNPLGEIFFAQRNCFHSHVGMRKTTELCALTRVNTRLIGFKTQGLHSTRHRIALAV